MKSYELVEIDRLPDKYKPLTAWGYFWLSVLYTIPVIGLIFLIAFSISDANVNRRSHARSYFCIFGLIAVVVIAVAVLSLFGIDVLSFLKKE